jgi:hypothetical protein
MLIKSFKIQLINNGRCHSKQIKKVWRCSRIQTFTIRVYWWFNFLTIYTFPIKIQHWPKKMPLSRKCPARRTIVPDCFSLNHKRINKPNNIKTILYLVIERSYKKIHPQTRTYIYYLVLIMVELLSKTRWFRDLW